LRDEREKVKGRIEGSVGSEAMCRMACVGTAVVC